MNIFTLYRSAYERGFQDAKSGARRLAEWELAVSNPVSLLPLVDTQSYFRGYENGYRDGIATRHILPRLP